VFTKIARDGICIVTNSSNRLGNLSTSEVQAIFTGQVRDWSQVPGSGISGTIDLYDRDAASGTQDAFQNIFLGLDLKVAPNASTESSNGLVQSAVRGDPNAIGFVSFAFVSGLNVVGYQGVSCTLRNATSGQYLGVRNFWAVTKGAPKGAAKSFIGWITSSHNTTARRIISSNWIAIH
jgi:phosphate transport system substrate-binding protein